MASSSVLPTGVRRVCWSPRCPESTARSLSFTHTSSCRGSRLRRRPLPLLLPCTSTSPLPPHPSTQLPRTSPPSWHSIRHQRTRPIPARLCQLTPTRHRGPSTPTPTRRLYGYGSSSIFSMWSSVQSAGTAGLLVSFLYFSHQKAVDQQGNMLNTCNDCGCHCLRSTNLSALMIFFISFSLRKWSSENDQILWGPQSIITNRPLWGS